MIAHTLALDYSLHPGWMAPFVDGLMKGEVVARHCEGCGSKSFPPQRSCACSASNAVWVTLPGTATIQFRTTGSDGDFALVHFDGADTSAVVRLQGIAPDQTRGQCCTAEGAPPMMVVGPISGDNS